MRDLIVIIPVYNAEKNISKIVSELLLCVPWIHYVVVDDASTDTTKTICNEKGYHIISHSNHYGLETTIETGYKFALRHGYERIIRFDGSGCYSPKDISKFIDMFSRYSDIVIGSKFTNEKHMQISDKILSNLIYSTNNKKISDLNSGFTGVSSRIAREIILSNNKTLTTSFISNKLLEGYTISEIPVKYLALNNNKYFKKLSFFGALSHWFSHKLLRKRDK